MGGRQRSRYRRREVDIHPELGIAVLGCRHHAALTCCSAAAINPSSLNKASRPSAHGCEQHRNVSSAATRRSRGFRPAPISSIAVSKPVHGALGFRCRRLSTVALALQSFARQARARNSALLFHGPTRSGSSALSRSIPVVARWSYHTSGLSCSPARKQRPHSGPRRCHRCRRQ